MPVEKLTRNDDRARRVIPTVPATTRRRSGWYAVALLALTLASGCSGSGSGSGSDQESTSPPTANTWSHNPRYWTLAPDSALTFPDKAIQRRYQLTDTLIRASVKPGWVHVERGSFTGSGNPDIFEMWCSPAVPASSCITATTLPAGAASYRHQVITHPGGPTGRVDGDTLTIRRQGDAAGWSSLIDVEGKRRDPKLDYDNSTAVFQATFVNNADKLALTVSDFQGVDFSIVDLGIGLRPLGVSGLSDAGGASLNEQIRRYTTSADLLKSTLLKRMSVVEKGVREDLDKERYRVFVPEKNGEFEVGFTKDRASTPAEREEVEAAIDRWFADRRAAIEQHGDEIFAELTAAFPWSEYTAS